MKHLTHLKTWIAGGLAATVLAVAGCTASPTVTTSPTSSTSTTTTTVGTVALTADHDDTADHTWDAADEIAINLSSPTATTGVTVSDGTITITAAGAYRLTGTLADAQVVVNTTETENVYLILDNASITNPDGPALSVLQAGLALVVLPEGTSSTLADGATYAASGEDDPDAALFSAANLTILGDGTLTVTGKHEDGIASTGGLVIVSGTVNVTAKDVGIRGDDYVVLKSGAVEVTSEGDGVQSDNETDAGLGYVSVLDGVLTVSSGDGGIDAWTAITIAGGSTTVATAVEGMESKVIGISGGTTTVTATEDGLNATDSASTAAGNQAQEGTLLSISGGELTVTADGDGLDSNGSIEMTGGTVVINGPTSSGDGALDYDGTFTITGGTLVAGGAAGMAQAPSTASAQKSLMFTVSAGSGSTVEVKDAAGNTIATYSPTRQIASLVVSTPAVQQDVTYTVYVDGTAAGTTDSSKATGNPGRR